MRPIKVLPVILMSASLALAIGCDPQTAILKLFANQGLTLLEPARDYIQIGGIVVLPKGSAKLQYIDPYDTLPPATGTSTNFQAVIQSQTDTTSTGASVSLALSDMVSLPIGFSFNTGQQVKLAQITSSGQRYTSPMISTLLKQPATSEKIGPLIQAGDRVFIIQEVYKATELSVSAVSNTSLQASVGGKPVTTQCTGANAASGTNGSGAATGSGANAASGTNGSGTPNGAGTNAAGGANGSATPNGAGAKAAGGANGSATEQGVAVNVCRNSDAQLSFTSTTSIPFAVRLNEVQPGPGGILTVKYTGFKLPNLALGSESDLAATVLIDSQNPMLGQLEHIKH